MLSKFESLDNTEKRVFVHADLITPEDLIGKYILPFADLKINIELDNVQLRDSFEGKVYEQLLPFQKYCVDQYKRIADMKYNVVFRDEETSYGIGFIFFDPSTDIHYFSVHKYVNVDKSDEQQAFMLETIKFDDPIPGTNTTYLIPTNIPLSSLRVSTLEAIIPNRYIKGWMNEITLNPFEYGVYMDKVCYSKTPFHIRNYFQNGGKALNQIIDTDLYR